MTGIGRFGHYERQAVFIEEGKEKPVQVSNMTCAAAEKLRGRYYVNYDDDRKAGKIHVVDMVFLGEDKAEDLGPDVYVT